MLVSCLILVHNVMAEGAGGYSDGGGSRNFRSSYYEKLGFCGNEEKNILDLLIASCPFSLEKLNEFCERFDFDRKCVETWKVLLGVECDRKNPFDEFSNVRRVRAEHFQSLKHNLEVLLRHNVVISKRLNKCSKLESQTKPLDDNKHLQRNCNNIDHHHNVKECAEEPQQHQQHSDDVSIGGQENQANTIFPQNNGVTDNHISENFANVSLENNHQSSESNNPLENIETNPGKQITLMYLLEAGKLDSSDIDAQLESTYCRKLSAMASFFANVSGDLQEAFFLFRNFVRKLEENETLDRSLVK